MTDNENEFYDIKNFKGYKINKKGEIYSDKSKQILKTRICNGYKTINFVFSTSPDYTKIESN